jgi:hypothetical protein
MMQKKKGRDFERLGAAVSGCEVGGRAFCIPNGPQKYLGRRLRRKSSCPRIRAQLNRCSGRAGELRSPLRSRCLLRPACTPASEVTRHVAAGAAGEDAFHSNGRGNGRGIQELKRVHERTLQELSERLRSGCSTASARTPLAPSRDAIVAWIDRGKISSEG